MAVPGQLMQEPRRDTTGYPKSANKTTTDWRLGSAYFLAVIMMLLPVLLARPLLYYDDAALIGALKQIDSLSSWLGHYAQGRAIDLQPVRDITYLFDLWVETQVNVRVHHFTNLLLYLWLGQLVFRICGEVGLRSRTQAWATAIFLVHPIHIEAVAWASGRKFLLAGALLAYATLLALRIRNRCEITAVVSRYYFFMVAAYIASLLSQPIGILFAIWALWYLFPQRKQLPYMMLCFVFGITSAIFSVANLLYYSIAFVNQSGFDKFQDFSIHRAMAALWSLGRSVFNLTIPFRLSILYSQTAVWNFVGLAIVLSLLILFFVSQRRNLNVESPITNGRATTLSFVVWTILVYLPVGNVLPVNIFAADRYLYVPSIGIIVLLASLWDKGRERGISIGSILPATLVASFFFQSFFQTQLWTSEQRLFMAARQVEPYWQTCLWAGHIAFKQNDFALARREFACAQEDYPDAPMLAKDLTLLS